MGKKIVIDEEKIDWLKNHWEHDTQMSHLLQTITDISKPLSETVKPWLEEAYESGYYSKGKDSGDLELENFKEQYIQRTLKSLDK